MLGLDPNEKLKLDEQGSIFLNSKLKSSETIIETHTNGYVDSSCENDKNRRDVSTMFKDQDNEVDDISTSDE